MTDDKTPRALTPEERAELEQREANGEFDDPNVCIGCGS